MKQKHEKIQPLGEMATMLDELKAQGKTIVHSHGIYNFLHSGHIQSLAAAKKEGDILVVTITPDRYFSNASQADRKIVPETLRAEALIALHDVDYVTIGESPTSIEAIRLFQPNVYARICDFSDAPDCIVAGIDEERAAVLEGGGVWANDNTNFIEPEFFASSFSVYPANVEDYLQEFRHNHDFCDILKTLEGLRSLKVMVIGETILDEYVYGNVMGKSSKEPILALRFLSQESHVGGSVVIANHLAGFCDSVRLVTYLGENDSREDFIRQDLKPNIRPFFISKPNSPTIVKRRFVENYSMAKLMEIYEMNDHVITGKEEDALCDILESNLSDCDVVIAADYGHGLISDRVVEMLNRKARFLAVNTQINAANNGFHTLSKYPCADYVCVQEGEIRLDQRSRSGELRELVTNVAKRMESSLVMITRGKHGTLLYHAPEGFYECPALSVKVVDRVGAGDSVLAITSLCAAGGLAPDLIGFVANMVGAQAVTIMGNRTPIDREKLFDDIRYILKG
jgi:rfaE bifunctional protein kinase chain/domain